MGFVELGNGESQLAAAPVFQAMNRSVIALDQAAVTFQHGRNLLALVRVDQKTYFKVSHCDSLWVCQYGSSRTIKASLVIEVKQGNSLLSEGRGL